MAVQSHYRIAGLVPASFAGNWLLYQIVLMPLVKRAEIRVCWKSTASSARFGVLFFIQGVMLVIFGGSLQSYSYLSVPVHILAPRWHSTASSRSCLR